jgi:RHS repeat-associated protein
MLRYDAFGGRSATSGTDGYYPSASQFAGDSGYQTEYASATEPGVGLQYLDQRYYDPAVGRFISQDPLGAGGGLNLYGYAANNPVGLVDPSGRLSLEDIRQFDYNYRYQLGAVAGLATTALTFNPVAGAAVGGYITGQNSYNGTGDLESAATDGVLVGSGVYELTGAVAMGAAGYQYQFGNFEAETAGVSCGTAGVALSGSKGGSASSGAVVFEVGSYGELSKAAKGLGMEAHKLPQAQLAEQVIPGYTREEGLAILLPKGLHRALPGSSPLTGDLAGLSNQEVRAAVSQQIRDLLDAEVPRSALNELGAEMRARYGSSRLYAK